MQKVHEKRLRMVALKNLEKVKLEGTMSKKQQAQYNKLVAKVESKGWKVKAGLYETQKSFFVFTDDNSDNIMRYDSAMREKAWNVQPKITNFTLETVNEVAKTFIASNGACGQCLEIKMVPRENEKRTNCMAYCRCGLGHEWCMRASDVVRNRSWCSKCANNITLNIVAARALIRKHGGWLRSTDYINTKTKLDVTCAYLHRFRATHDSIQQGRWCDICNESKGERAVRMYLIKKDIPFKAEMIFDTLLSGKGYHLRFDFYLHGRRVVIEFDGIQHEKPIKRFKGELGLIGRMQSDEIKYQWCVEEKESLLRIRHFQLKKVDEILDAFLKRVSIEGHVIVDNFRPKRLELLPKLLAKYENDLEVAEE